MKIHYIDYHRNGVSGTGFNVVVFDDKEAGEKKRTMLGIVFPDRGNCAVFDISLVAKGDVRFFFNSWRGDHYEDDLRTAIAANDDFLRQGNDMKLYDQERAKAEKYVAAFKLPLSI